METDNDCNIKYFMSNLRKFQLKNLNYYDEAFTAKIV